MRERLSSQAYFFQYWKITLNYYIFYLINYQIIYFLLLFYLFLQTLMIESTYIQPKFFYFSFTSWYVGGCWFIGSVSSWFSLGSNLSIDRQIQIFANISKPLQLLIRSQSQLVKYPLGPIFSVFLWKYDELINYFRIIIKNERKLKKKCRDSKWKGFSDSF